MIPLVALALFAGAEYLILKKHDVSARSVDVPIPPPNPNGMPPAGVQSLPPQLDLSVELPFGARPGQMVTAVWTYTSGPNQGDQGESTTMPLAWVSPDGTRAAVVFNVTTVPEATVGGIYYARVKAPSFT